MKRQVLGRKILFISRLYHPHIGGVEKHIAEISKIFLRKGDSITVLCEQHDKKLKTKERINNIDVVRIPILANEKSKKFLIWIWITKNRKFIKDFDIIHIHDVFYWIIPLIFYLDRNKIFITFHGYESYPIKITSKIQKKVAAKYCSGSIAVGKFINKWYGIASSAVINGGVVKSLYAKNPKKIVNTALFFGRLEQQTGIKEYYEAFLKLNRDEKFKLKVIGDGPYGKKIKKITVFPFKSDITSDIRESRFIFVSRYLSILEAMVEKRIVIAVFSDPIKKDYLLQSPFAKYIEVCSSSREIAASVKFYQDNPKKEKEKVEKAFDWAKKQTWDNVVKTYEEIWNL